MKQVLRFSIAFTIIALVTVAAVFQFSKKEHFESGRLGYYRMEVVLKDNCWIYEIYKEDTLFIRQEYIPAVQGQQTFESAKDAARIGRLVLEKLESNGFPVVTIQDLKANHITFKPI